MDSRKCEATVLSVMPFLHTKRQQGDLSNQGHRLKDTREIKRTKKEPN